MLSAFLKKNKVKESDTVQIVSKKQVFEGIILPSHVENVLTLKLTSGYNAGIKISTISSVKKIGSTKGVAKAQRIEIKKKKGLPTISILHTGGTIAGHVDYTTGAIFNSFEPADLISLFPEISELANIDSQLISNMFSEDMRFAHYNKIAETIKKEMKKKPRGIVITHGTDTLHYTAAAIAFMVENPGIPILLVGAQRSSDRGSSDAAMNVTCAFEFVTKTDFAGVAICMHENQSDERCVILPACKTRKMHTSRRDAFKPVNDTPIATIDYATRKILFVKKEYARYQKNPKPLFKTKMADAVALIKTHPHFKASLIDHLKKTGIKGLVVEGTGMGHMTVGTPDPLCKPENPKIKKAVERLIASGCIVVMTSQTLYGRVHMHVYTNGVTLADMGVIPGEDMLPETAFVKLAWLLGNHTKSDAKKLITTNLRGEITPATGINTFNLPPGK